MTFAKEFAPDASESVGIAVNLKRLRLAAARKVNTDMHALNSWRLVQRANVLLQCLKPQLD